LLNGIFGRFSAKNGEKSQIFNSLIIRRLENARFSVKTFSTENLFVFN